MAKGDIGITIILIFAIVFLVWVLERAIDEKDIKKLECEKMDLKLEYIGDNDYCCDENHNCKVIGYECKSWLNYDCEAFIVNVK